jgi:hypothetical protein
MICSFISLLKFGVFAVAIPTPGEPAEQIRRYPAAAVQEPLDEGYPKLNRCTTTRRGSGYGDTIFGSTVAPLI